MIRFLTDEDLRGPIITGLRRRVPTIDLIRVVDVGLGGRPDPEVLNYAAETERVLVTQDVSTMVAYVAQRIENGLAFPG